MKNYFDEIEKKLRRQIKFESLEIVDNSHSAQKLIMKVLKDDLKSRIHALEISIEQ